MRIATNQQANTMINHMHRSYGNWTRAQVQVSTGKKYENFSENTAAASRILSLNHAIADISRTETNIDEAKGVLDTAEGALNSMTKVLQRINDLTLQVANGTSNNEDISSAKVEIDELIKQIENYANTNDNGMYLFGGKNFSEKPIEFIEGTGYVYNGSRDGDGSPNALQYNISPGYSVDVLRSGEGFVDILNNLHKLSNTLGDAADGVEGARDDLRGLVENNSNNITIVSGMLTDIGTTVSSLDTHKTAIYSQRLALETRRSNIEDVDQTKAITDVNLTKFAYEATLSMLGQLSSTSILKYL